MCVKYLVIIDLGNIHLTLSLGAKSTFTSSRHWIIFFLCFSTFVSLALSLAFLYFTPGQSGARPVSRVMSSCLQPIFVLPGLKSSLDYIIFWMGMQVLVVTPPPTHLHVDMPPNMPPMQFTWHFYWGTTCILFIFENRCTFCYATRVTCVAFPLRNNLCCIYFRKKRISCYATHAT